MTRREIPLATLEKQKLAADPRRSAWVSANAGSGKTFVLARRVVRLLLSGTEPSRLLCLTFTKAAAAEMSNRVFDTLGKWTNYDDARLSEELFDIEGEVPDARKLALARHLFAKALETPGGLKIQTIHAFCESLLHQFPLEANVAGHFSVLDDRLADELLALSHAAALQKAEADSQSPMGRALAVLVANMSDDGVDKALTELVSKRDTLSRWLDAAGGLSGAFAELRRIFDVGDGETLESALESMRADSLIDPQMALAIAEALDTGGKTDKGRAEALRAAARAKGDEAWWTLWPPIFLTKEMTPRKTLATKAVAHSYPDSVELLERERERLVAALEKRKRLLCVEGTQALLTLADAVLSRYQREKTRRGVLDFEDLVVRAANLLSNSDAAQWVQYKLDQGLDHILVDEAQDTSPRQWQVIKSLAEEFFSGAGARRLQRTIFAVGDEKQSIYSFQGAIPAYFAEMRAFFDKKAQQAETPFSRVDLTLSFRSTPDVLGAVDQVFALPSVFKGLSQEGAAPVHEAIRRGAPGLVEVWPMEKPEASPPPDDWSAPIDRESNSSPMIRLARRLAATIRDWNAQGVAAPGDVLVLVRKRGAFVEALNRELKRLAVPIAGSDRLVLTEHIAVRDLVALGRFLLLPEDDLSLAAVLRSPLFSMSDEDLFEIARETPERVRAGTLWQSLLRRAQEESAGEQGKWESVRRQLDQWRTRADFAPPFEFYARVLAADGARARFLARLGMEADDVLDEFLSLALSYEQLGLPGLEGFLEWLSAAPTEIKRELNAAGDVVRVMTVHGSKGLEAKVVILVDPGSAPSIASHDPALLECPRGGRVADAPALVWRPVKAERSLWHEEALEARRDLAEEEYRRLLYVAMTRAEDRLLVCGYAGKNGPHEACWHRLVWNGLTEDARKELDDNGEIRRLLWRKNGAGEDMHEAGPPSCESGGGSAPTNEGAGEETRAAAMTAPAWLRSPASQPPRPKRLQPSKAFEEMEAKEGLESVAPQTSLQRQLVPVNWPITRGLIVHRLLETLPDLDLAEREAAARRYLEHALPAQFSDRRDEILESVFAVLQDPDLELLFGPESRAEAPIVGQVSGPDGVNVDVSGQIDRLWIGDEAILICDYKTNAAAPAGVEAAPGEYVTQLAIYRTLLRRMYPKHEIRCAILWTSEPRLMELPVEMLEQATEALR